MPTLSGETRKDRRRWLDPSTWHLRTRLVLVAMALLVAICGAIGLFSYASMDSFLTRQLDERLGQASRLSNEAGRPRPSNPSGRQDGFDGQAKVSARSSRA